MSCPRCNWPSYEPGTGNCQSHATTSRCRKCRRWVPKRDTYTVELEPKMDEAYSGLQWAMAEKVVECKSCFKPPDNLARQGEELGLP